MSSALDDNGIHVVDSRFMFRVFYAFAALAFASLAISVAGKWAGNAIALAGHTEDASLKEIVIGNNVLAVPANAIRFEHARRDGVAARLDLYLRWPDLGGYSAAARDDFNNAHGRKTILFLSFEEPMMSRDMSGRWTPIYSRLVETPGTPAEGGLELFRFTEKSGYLNEVLAVASGGDDGPFVARCLIGPAAEQSLAPCERDVRIGKELSLVYRFPRELLKDWQALDAALVLKAKAFLKTDG